MCRKSSSVSCERRKLRDRESKQRRSARRRRNAARRRPSVSQQRAYVTDSFNTLSLSHLSDNLSHFNLQPEERERAAQMERNAREDFESRIADLDVSYKKFWGDSRLT